MMFCGKILHFGQEPAYSRSRAGGHLRRKKPQLHMDWVSFIIICHSTQMQQEILVFLNMDEEIAVFLCTVLHL